MRIRRRLSILCCLLAAILALGLAPAHARDIGIVLKPQNEQQNRAAQLLIQAAQLLKAKQPFKARPLMEQAVALWPESAHAHFNLGCCYSEMGDFAHAIGEYKTALHLDRHLSECLPNIATCYQLMGQYDEAIAFFTDYLKKNPNAPDAQDVKGMIAALHRQESRQVDTDPQGGDYLGSVSPRGMIERWPQTKLPLKIFISAGTDEQGQYVPQFREYYNEMLLDALNTWVKASNYRLAYTLVDDARNADIVCTWTNRRDFLQEQSTSVEQGAARVSSHMAPNANSSEISHVRVIVLVIEPSSGQNISDDDMKKTCLHELGHALGFGGHSNNNKDVMFFSESPTVWASLTKRDKNTMAKLYSDYPTYQWQNAALQQPSASWPQGNGGAMYQANQSPQQPMMQMNNQQWQQFPAAAQSPQMQQMPMGQPFQQYQPNQQFQQYQRPYGN